MIARLITVMSAKHSNKNKKSNWNTNARPMGVSPDEVLLGWLKQAGNYDRFSRADSDAKKAGRVHESKIDVAREILVLLQNAGFQEFVASGIVVRLTLWIKKYNAAHDLARAGENELQVERAFNYYYQVVDDIENGRVASADPESPRPLSTMSSGNFRTSRESPLLENGPIVESSLCELSGENIIRQQRRQRRPVARYTGESTPVPSGGNSSNRNNLRQARSARNAALVRYPTRQHEYPESISQLLAQHYNQTSHILDMHDKQLTRLVDQYRDLVREISRSHRSQQLQMQTSLTVSLVDSMKNAGFSKEEISAHIKQLHQSQSNDSHQ
ncbi:hypothetical protein K492DRAFT_236815 [Lichtheimia hyalospora FSU 10163]|nr:hypothetical protein K492DRAFT_236815 [Lichtheimia hyalospora FSU 10163]